MLKAQLSVIEYQKSRRRHNCCAQNNHCLKSLSPLCKEAQFLAERLRDVLPALTKMSVTLTKELV